MRLFELMNVITPPSGKMVNKINEGKLTHKVVERIIQTAGSTQVSPADFARLIQSAKSDPKFGA